MTRTGPIQSRGATAASSIAGLASIGAQRYWLLIQEPRGRPRPIRPSAASCNRWVGHPRAQDVEHARRVGGVEPDEAAGGVDQVRGECSPREVMAPGEPPPPLVDPDPFHGA